MGKFQLGSYQHKKLSCELITENHQDFDLNQLDWPDLDSETRAKLAGLPWRSLGQPYLTAAQVIQTFGANHKATILRQALTQMATETQRQGQFLQGIAARYGVNGVKSLKSTRNLAVDDSFVGADYKRVSHCLNVSFFLGAGLYELVAQANYLPQELLKLFDQQLDEQARHACFFVNWLVIEAQEQQKPEYEGLGLFALWYQRQQILSLVRALNRNEYDDNLPKDPSPGDIFMGQWRFSEFLQACSQGYERRFSAFDAKLKRPNFLPQVARISKTFFGFWPERVSEPRQSSI